MRASFPALLVLVTAGFGVAQPLHPAKFRPGCELPFASIAESGLPIDKTCGITGNSTTKAKELESRAKNNFCAQGEPTIITYQTFQRLQTNTDNRIDDIKPGLKTNRATALAKMTTVGGVPLGEGSLVRYVSYLLEAHYSNTRKQTPPRKNGELVNCNQRPEEFNDIHIELVADPDEDDACNSTTAEISPHFRPETWDNIVNLKLNNRPVRITGPLFFDSSHRPCTEEKREKPARISVWEIHPIYEIEVCRSRGIAKCDANDNKIWIPLDQWDSHKDNDQ